LKKFNAKTKALWKASSSDELKRLIEAGADVNQCDSEKRTAMHHIACGDDKGRYSDPEVMLQCLIDAGANIEACEKDGKTPLLMAASLVGENTRLLKIMKLLLKNGADFDASVWIDDDFFYFTAVLMDFLKWGTKGDLKRDMLEEVVCEIRRVTRPNATDAARDETNLDLMIAAFWGSAADLASIVSCGGKVDARSAQGYTPLMFSSIWGNREALEFFIDRGANLEAKICQGKFAAETALTLVTRMSDLSTIRAIVNADANIENTDSQGRAPLIISMDFGCEPQIVRFFLDAGADVNTRDQEGRTALMHVAESAPGNLEIARILISAGADVNLTDNDGCTALEIAMDAKHDSTAKLGFMEFLLDAGADPRLMKPGDGAEREDKNSRDLMRRLSEHGLKPHTLYRDVFADESAKALVAAVRNGFDIFGEDKSGKSFYEAAIRYGTRQVIGACIERGAKFHSWSRPEMSVMETYPGDWPIAAAVEAQNPGAVKILIKSGDVYYRDLHCQVWHMRANVFPEGANDPTAQRWKARLDAGAAILKTLRAADRKFLKKDGQGNDLTYVFAGYSDRHEEHESTDIGDGDVERLRRAVSPGALKLLIDMGPDVNARDAEGLTIMHHLARDGGGYLAGRKRFSDASELEHYEAYFRPEAMIQLLIDAGADVNARDNAGNTPLMLLLENFTGSRSLAMIQVLAEGGADFNAKNRNEKLPLTSLEHFGDCRYVIQEIQRVFAHGAETHEARSANLNLLIAACGGTVHQVEEVLSCGADVNARFQGGMTALMAAGCLEDRRDRKTGITTTRAEVVRSLIRNGADVNATNERGDTPLTLNARRHGAGAIIRALVEAGADTSAKNGEGKNAFFLAWDGRNFNALKVLLACGAGEKTH
jgi:ankyrin repeat protein